MQCATDPYCTIMKLDLGWIVLGRAGMTPDGNAFGELVLAWIVLGRASMTPDGNRFGEGLDTFIMELAICFG